ncbi:MAG: YbhB/YbcL family Raf kinase inhibitor-like protein [Candidatus Auribacter fodinae]|jgi:Raf kinase inhibitor-like YbhB/YbcL family protein|uniref:YbhB/YbcL family Raf kinase inhibitor-like protein n=1 Tax=Candidatus Auribacter fodinae TaxID=2093366 RepID=A0A3A4R3G6_9BACT|nr:MAG: YbhB/YbcL family Raf kinase inhibitor-like protein [Candidatus Auribacter fodinae]
MKMLTRLTVTSQSFNHDEMMDSCYTCDGRNISPHLNWSGAPDHTKCFAVSCVDPDAPSGSFVHWMVYNIPVSTHDISESGVFKSPAVTLKNDFGRAEYGGPCPPSGTHRYFFTVYALDSGSLSAGNKREFFKLVEDHCIAKGYIIGKYSRKP